MSALQEVVSWADDYLNISKIPDYPDAYNGLQVENDGRVEKVGAAVDCSLHTIQEAVKHGVDLMVVHHGLYWQGVEMLTGVWREKVRLLMENNIAVYSSHIPLDIHSESGNNVLLARALGLEDITPCLDWKGVQMAVRGRAGISRELLKDKITELLGVCPFTSLEGEDTVEELYVITGGAGSQIKKIKEMGGKNFLSGESSHWTVPYAEEQQMNFFLASHYLTETFGVKALSELIAAQASHRQVVCLQGKKFL